MAKEENEKSVKEIYDELRKKYNVLPEYSSLNHEFEISVIEKHDFILRNIIRRIIERFEGFSSLIEELMQGETQMSNMYEWKSLNESAKKELMEVYRQLMLEIRTALEASFDTSDEKEAKYLASVFKKWLELKPRLKKIVTALKNSWTEDKHVAEKLEYMG